jgi:hypothetical protein
MEPIFLPPPFNMDNKKPLWKRYTEDRYQRVLELGPYCGNDSVWIAQQTDCLVCVEGRLENVFATRAALDASGLSHSGTVIHDNLETCDLAALGEFDCVWAVGVIYHVERPDLLIAQIAQVTDWCLGWSHLIAEPTGERGGYEGSAYREGTDRLAGLCAEAWWLTSAAFQCVWSDLGWRCDWLTQPAPHINGGLAACFEARKITGEPR